MLIALLTMNLYTYRKNSVSVDYSALDELNYRLYSNVPNASRKSLTIGSILTSGYNSLKDFASTSALTGILLPGILIIAGGFFIYQQFFPEIKQMVEVNSGYLTQGTIAPVSESYIQASEFISNPSGLSQLIQSAMDTHILQEDSVSKNFNGTFYITIPSLGIDRIPVQSNVQSDTEDIYNQVLQTKLAHFQGTGLPISNIKNNIVVYGHSAAPLYNPQRTDPYVAFTFLPELKVGDDIAIEIEGKTFNYKMYKSKIVNPTDVSIITGQSGKRTLTLFTCYPAGNNSQRYVAIAREV
jgi:LPXTG-site transpeptidase (sortase) family protein